MCQLETWDALLVRLGGCTASGSASPLTLVVSSLARGQCLCSPPPPPLSHAAPIHVDSSRLHTCLLRDLFKHINTRHLRACLLPTPHMPMIILVCCGNFQERSTSCRAYQALLTELHSMHKPGQVPAVWLIWQMHNKEAGICSLRIFPLWCDICQMSTAPSSCSG